MGNVCDAVTVEGERLGIKFCFCSSLPLLKPSPACREELRGNMQTVDMLDAGIEGFLSFAMDLMIQP